MTKLTGKTHTVMTAVFIAFMDKEMNIQHKGELVDKTEVEFYTLSDQMIKDYVKTGEAYGKAGCYGIQGSAATWIKKINGWYYSVWGFPLSQFWVKLIDMIETTQFLDE